MTFRLILFMSVVLLISLAAFAILVDHYQDRVMDELQHTVSLVASETLKTSARIEEKDLDLPPGMRWREEIKVHSDGRKRLMVRKLHGTHGDAEVISDDELVVKTHPGGATGVVVTHELLDCADESQVCGGQAEGEQRFVFVHSDVRVEKEPGQGLAMFIPTLHSAASASAAAAPTGKTAVREIRLPIPTRDYALHYSDMRRRSAYMFLGVFVLGSLLSAVFAARFTRPVRRLDEGLKTLSSGDLDVQVEVSGNDEIGRLGRAFNDLTRRLRANRERAQELTRREKQTALGRLAAGVAHDIRNPLHSIGLTLQHLQETSAPSEPEKQQEFARSLKIIRAEIGRLDQLVGNFLRFARSERKPREPIQLQDLLADTLNLVAKEAERREVVTKLVVPEQLPDIMVDREALGSAVLNLVLNSFDAMPDGGTLTLELSQVDAELWIEVTDTGRGIPPSDHEKVFEFAYTTSPEGNGLGLAMVHQVVVEEHAGRVVLDSTPGAGTTLRLALPLDPPEQRG